MELQASESVLGSYLSGVAQRSGEAAGECVLGSLLSGQVLRGPVWLQASESVLCSCVPGEAPWVAFAPVGDGPVECDVLTHLAEGPIVVWAALC